MVCRTFFGIVSAFRFCEFPEQLSSKAGFKGNSPGRADLMTAIAPDAWFFVQYRKTMFQPECFTRADEDALSAGLT